MLKINLDDYCCVIWVSFHALYYLTDCSVFFLIIRKLCFRQNTKCCRMAVVIHLAYQSQLCVWLRCIHFSMKSQNQLSSLLNEPIKEHGFTHSLGQREIKDGTMSSSMAHLTKSSLTAMKTSQFSHAVICHQLRVTTSASSIIHYIKINTSEEQENIDISKYDNF